MIFTRQSYIGSFLAATGILALLFWPAAAGALPGPTGQHFITPYPAIASAVVNTDAVTSRPIAFGAVALGNGALNLQVQTDTLDVAMDAYLAILAPRVAPGVLLLVNAAGGLQPFTGTLVPWKTGITTLNESLFGSIPLVALPADDYSVYLLLVRESSGNPLGGNFYLWASTLPLGTASGTEGINNLTLFTNPTDSGLLAFLTDTGEQLTLLGRKGAAGATQTVTQIDLVDAAGAEFTVELDQYGLVSRVSDAEGHFISFDLTGGQGGKQGHALAGETTPINVTSVPARLGTSAGGVAFETVLVPDAPIIVDLDQALAELNAQEPAGNLAINVFQCGKPAAPSSVSVRLGRPGMGYTNRYAAYATSTPGRYVANIPQHNDDVRDVAAACQSVDAALGKVCAVNGTTDPTIQSGLCVQLAGAVEVANPLPGDAVAVFPLCMAAFKAAHFACWIFGFSPDPTPDATSLLGAICNNVEPTLRSVDRALGTDTFVLQAVADFQGGVPSISVPGSQTGIAASDPVNASVFGPFPDITVNHDEGCVGPSLEGMTFPAYFKGTGTGQIHYSNPNSGSVDCTLENLVIVAKVGGIGIWDGLLKVYSDRAPYYNTTGGELKCQPWPAPWGIANGRYSADGTYHEIFDDDTYAGVADVNFNKDFLWGSVTGTQTIAVYGGDQITHREWQFDLEKSTEAEYNAIVAH